jgi:biotin-(acetyl-CoA carboxylase) ligase
MPLKTRSISAEELTLPPLYRAVRLRELGDAFAQAQTLAPQHGAGTLVHVGRFDLAEFALVLEPDEPLHRARRVFYAGMAALADALAAAAPPETAINIEWPDALYVNWGLVGGGRLAWPSKTREDEIPAWLVFGGMVRTATSPGAEPGATPDITALDEEGFAEILASHLIERFARNFMHLVDAWRESGFGAVAKAYFERFPLEKKLSRDIDDDGNLAERNPTSAHAERKPLLQALKQPSWYDPSTKGLRG